MVANCREDLKTYALRKLGHPVLQINVSPDQVDDRIDEALSVYWEHHHEGSYRDYITHILSQEEIDTKTIYLDEWIYTVLRIIPLSFYNNVSVFEYQSFMQQMGNKYTLGGGLVNYTVSMSYMSLLDDYFNRQKIIRFNQRYNKIQIDSSISMSAGLYIIVEAYRFSDPDVYREVWNDVWLKNYATSLIKLQWGQNLIKYDGFQLPSGTTLNGRSLYEDARTELAELKEQLFSEETLPSDFFMG